MGVVPKRKFGEMFEEIFVDSGAAREGSAGFVHYKAYCDFVGKYPYIDDSRAATCHFEIGSSKFLGTDSILFPIGHIWLSIDVQVVIADISFLRSVDDMDPLGFCLNYLNKKLVHQVSVLKFFIARTRGHPFMT